MSGKNNLRLKRLVSPGRASCVVLSDMSSNLSATIALTHMIKINAQTLQPFLPGGGASCITTRISVAEKSFESSLIVLLKKADVFFVFDLYNELP
jgi:hypothetical protein